MNSINSLKIPTLLSMLLTVSILHTLISGCESSDDSDNTKQKIEIIPGTFPLGTECGAECTVEGIIIRNMQLLENRDRCDFSQEGEDMWLYPGMISFDVSQLDFIKKITITGKDNCRIGCSSAILYNADGDTLYQKSNPVTGEDYTLSFDQDLSGVKSFSISSYEGSFSKIIIELD